MLLFVIFGLSLTLSIVVSCGNQTILNTVLDFAHVQGFKNLHYGYREAGVSPVDAWNDFSTFEENSLSWTDSSFASPLMVNKHIMHANTTHNAARLWISNVEGKLHITGEVFKPFAGGDGITFTVQVQTTTVFHRYLYNANQRVAVNVYADIQVGTVVALICSSGKTHDFDQLSTRFIFASGKNSNVVLMDTSKATQLVQGHDNLFYLFRIQNISWLPLFLAGLDSRNFLISAVNLGGGSMGGLAIGRFIMHPGMADGEKAEIAKSWRSTIHGNVSLTGEVVKQTSGGDGVLLEVYVGSKIVLSHIILLPRVKFEFTLDATLSLNETVIFSIGVVNNDYFDSVWTRFIITSLGQTINTGASVIPQILVKPTSTSEKLCDTLGGTICAPRVFIVGTMKCGTNTLGAILKQHPSIAPPFFLDEPDFFFPYRQASWWNFKYTVASAHDTPLQQYGAMFPSTDWVHNFSFDRSPSYLQSFKAAASIRRLIPRAKILIATCEPIQRLWSEYWHVRSWPDQLSLYPIFSLPFDDFVHATHKSVNLELLRKGGINASSSMWKLLFGPENVFIWNRDAYDTNPHISVNVLFAFLGLTAPNASTLIVANQNYISHNIEFMNMSSRVALQEWYDHNS